MHVLRLWTRGGRPAVGFCRRGRGATPRRPSGRASGAPWKATRRREARAAGCSSQQRHPATGPLGPVPEAAAASRARRAATCRRRGGAADRLEQQTVSRSAAKPIGSLKRDAEHGGRSAGRPQGWRGWAGAVSRGGGACAGAGRGSPGTWQFDGHPGSSVSRRDRLCQVPPSARAPPPGPGRPCEQRQQQRGRPRWCSCSAGARAARSCAGTWQHRDVDADRRAPSQRCLASRGGARAPLAARRSLGRRRGGRGGQRSRGHRPWEVAGTSLTPV